MTVDVVLPCLDEATALPWVLGRFPPGYRPLVVDNGSTDGSAEIARRLGASTVAEPRRSGRPAHQRGGRRLPAAGRAVQGHRYRPRHGTGGPGHERGTGSRRMTTLMVIAKAPVAGRVKTRLTPPFTPGEAAALAEAAL